jgi:type IV pilus assembly protein PilW
MNRERTNRQTDAPRLRSEPGFTLIELMVSLAIFSVVSLAAFSVLSSSQQTAVMNDQTVQVQRNVRLAVGLVARDLRMAGYGNPAAGALSGCPNHVNPTNSSSKSDSISVMTIDQPIGTLASAFTNGHSITVSGLASDTAAGQIITLEGIFTAEINTPTILTGVVTLYKPGTTTNMDIVSPQTIPAGTQVLRLACVTYTVSGADGVVPDSSPAVTYAPYQLLRNTSGSANNAVPIVDGIESLQLAYAVDEDKDGKIDDKNTSLTFDAGDFLSAAPTSINAVPTSARQVRVTVVGRAIPPAAANTPNNTWSDPTFKSGSAVAAEDVSIASTPGIRRRVLSRVVSLRDAYNQ